MNVSSPKPIAYFVALAVAGSLAACASNMTAPAANTVVDGEKSAPIKTSWKGKAVSSFSQRGDEGYQVGYYVNNGQLLAANSLLADSDASLSSLDLNVSANGEAFNAVIAHGAGTDLTLTGSINAMDNGDGSNVSDFSGLGAMVVASDGAKVTLDSMDIKTKGFARAAFIVAEHADMLVKNSEVVALGANPLTETYESYQNSANVTKMVSPPWVLGIQGGVRASNSLGEKPSLSLVDTSVTAGSWAVLSTDGCNYPQMTVVDSILEIMAGPEGGMSAGPFPYSAKYGSGYGTYAIGNANQEFYGSTIKGTTYGIIFTGGSATFDSSKGSIDLKDGEGKVLETVKGKGKPSVIESVWGFMAHSNADLKLLSGAVVNSEESTYLYKKGATNITVDGAELNPGNGIIVQMIDNDDSIVGVDSGAGDIVFNTEFNELPGWPSENGQITSKMPAAPAAGGPGGPGGAPGGPGGAPGGPGGAPGGPGGDMENVVGADGLPLAGASRRVSAANGLTITFMNGDYEGDLFNGTGYYAQSAVPMSVTIGKGAELEGAISLTETRHIDENGKQNTHFTINEYYYLGHVANRPFRNGDSEVSVTVKDGGVWEVTGESLLDSLTLANGQIVGDMGKTVVMTVNGRPTAIKPGSYEGDIVISLK